MSDTEVRVAGVAALVHGEARSFTYHRGDEEQEGFVLRVHDDLVAYRNQCAHWLVDLDMGEGDFWSERVGRIVCKTHGATYLPDTGVCDAGPCVGARLEPFAVRVDGDDVIVTIPAVDSRVYGD